MRLVATASAARTVDVVLLKTCKDPFSNTKISIYLIHEGKGKRSVSTALLTMPSYEQTTEFIYHSLVVARVLVGDHKWIPWL